MSKKRPKISNVIKKRLHAEAGHKCANPGCANRRTHIHHIREWAVYETHDELHMVAVCPQCHDAVHHGTLKIDDTTLYQWKRIARKTDVVHVPIYVEPADTVKVLLGSIAASARSGTTVFALSPKSNLRFAVVDGDLLRLNLSLSTQDGAELIRVVDGHLKYTVSTAIRFDQVPGKITVDAPATDEYVPSWVVEQIQQRGTRFVSDGRVRLFGLEVIKPGLVKLEGMWAYRGTAIVITAGRLYFVRQEGMCAAMEGAGENTVYWNPDEAGVLPLFRFG